jgi:hypothetical protein
MRAKHITDTWADCVQAMLLADLPTDRLDRMSAAGCAQRRAGHRSAQIVPLVVV